MSSKIYILVVVTIGFFMIPSISFACGSGCSSKKTESKESFNSEKHSKHQATENGCCNNKNQSKNDNGCSGKCKHNSCNCITPVLSLILPSFSELTINLFDFSTKKQKDFYSETIISSGFYSLWLIPKIS